MLTTITPYWGRPDSLQCLLKALVGASIPEVCHLIYVVGSQCHPNILPSHPQIRMVQRPEAPGESIGFYHNLGAKAANSEWIMKLDVDAIPNVRYFRELITVLKNARPREWFNCGMLLMSRASSAANLEQARMPLTEATYTRIVMNMRIHAHGSFAKPEASNFCCRRLDYLQQGGADPRFRNWGWEDYQQMYMLENHFRGTDPLPGLVDISNATQRCRDEIARPKAWELFLKNRWLCLLHRWHSPSPVPGYKTMEQSEANRRLVLEYILKTKQHGKNS